MSGPRDQSSRALSVSLGHSKQAQTANIMVCSIRFLSSWRQNRANCRVVSARLSSTDSGATCMWNILLGNLSHAWVCVKFKARGPSPTVTGSHFCRIQVFSLFLELKKKKKSQSRNAVCTFNRSQALLSPSGGFIHRLWSLLVKADPGDVGRLTQTKASFLGRITPWLTEWCWVSQRHLSDL